MILLIWQGVVLIDIEDEKLLYLVFLHLEDSVLVNDRRLTLNARYTLLEIFLVLKLLLEGDDDLWVLLNAKFGQFVENCRDFRLLLVGFLVIVR